MRAKKNPVKKKAVSHGKLFEEALMERFGLKKNTSPSPDLAGPGMLVEAKYSSGKEVLVWKEQLERIKKGTTQKDIYGERLKTYYAFGFGDRVYLVPVEKLAEMVEEEKIGHITKWGIKRRGKKYFDWMKAAESYNVHPSVVEREKLLERYGSPYVRLTEKEIKSIAEKEFKIPLKKRKGKKLNQNTLWF